MNNSNFTILGEMGFGLIFNPARMAEDDDPAVLATLTDLQKQRLYAKRDTRAILKCTHILMLKGWEFSVGARAEHALAVWLGLTIIYGG